MCAPGTVAESLSRDQVIANVCEIIKKAERLLIVISRPVDPDCVGTALACQWWLQQQSKKTKIISFVAVPRDMDDFPGIQTIRRADPGKFDFNHYGAIILVDGCDWAQFFGNQWSAVISRLDLKRVVNLDHHQPGDIREAVPGTCLNICTSSTAQVLYSCLMEPSSMVPPAEVAEWLYRALLYDTRIFRNELHPDQLSFAEKLLALGVDHAKAVDVNYEMREVEFMMWAVQHTRFMPELQLTLLVIDSTVQAELRQQFGKAWMDYDKLYKEQIERHIKGYNYGIILIDNLDGSIRFGWRTRNFGNHVSIGDAARRAGFQAGGHRNAGGGTFMGTLAEAESRLLQELERVLLPQDSSAGMSASLVTGVRAS
jgi:nanoRNase/pAp phosphatase (c-di-AMP/oligoRNAs hydrolase)